jgi:hypothetical protein
LLLIFGIVSPASAQWGVSTGYFDIDDQGNITVTETGAAAINAQIGDTVFYLTLDAVNQSGNVEAGTATIHTCCTPAPSDGPLAMPFVIYKWSEPHNTDSGHYQAASATVELLIADPTKLAEGGKIIFDGAVKKTCEVGQVCYYSAIEWDASLGNPHVIEGQVKMTNGNLYMTTLQIPATFRLTLFWSPNDDGKLQPVSDDIAYRSQEDCVNRAQQFFTSAANPQGLIKHFSCEGK